MKATVEFDDALYRLLKQDIPPPLVSDLVMAETFFALRHHYHVPETEALQALSRLAHDVRLAVTPAAKRVLSEPRTTGAGFIDRLIHAEYADLEACLLTFDKAAARLEGARLIVG
ncbi:MAG: hypothetical protein NT029_02195 [Armatimonadetes bacterium]|nr:hypothetical protein [Armatimonadota bacterium]